MTTVLASKFMITVILFIGGVQLLTIGIIGEYLSKVFVEVKNRPVYFVREYEGENNNE